jgi:hypothetical protein
MDFAAQNSFFKRTVVKVYFAGAVFMAFRWDRPKNPLKAVFSSLSVSFNEAFPEIIKTKVEFVV